MSHDKQDDTTTPQWRYVDGAPEGDYAAGGYFSGVFEPCGFVRRVVDGWDIYDSESAVWDEWNPSAGHRVFGPLSVDAAEEG